MKRTVPISLTGLFFGMVVLAQASFAQSNNAVFGKKQLQPYAANSRYWAYDGEPILLLGASNDDNLFQWEKAALRAHLDSLVAIGGNYVRNTMSDRDEGDLKAFYRGADGSYDLSRWNKSYWKRFKNFLRLTRKRGVMVQIEVWDRFDHSRESWESDPYNPKNNLNYTTGESGLDSVYPAHPAQNKQPFFFTVPALKDNKVVLAYQQAFVKKLLSIALRYDHVLYCMDNETNGDPGWGAYWASYMQNIAKRAEKQICITEMWDDWDVSSAMHRQTIDHPELYDFIDISQNSQTPGYANWKNAQAVFQRVRERPRPVNSVKIYGSAEAREHWRKRGIVAEHAIQSFCRNIIGGFASSRFHRPPSGLGLSPGSGNCIKAIRKVESLLKFWEIVPRMDLLQDADRNEAYLSAAEGEKYLLYFPSGGAVKLNLDKANTPYTLHWISIATGDWAQTVSLNGGKAVAVTAPDDTGWFAAIGEF